MWFILLTLLVVVIAIATVWTLTAGRASRMPHREPHERDHVGRT